MSRLPATFHCDGPTCLELIEDVEDEDDVAAAGWLIVAFNRDDEEREAHFHSHACLISWAQELVDA